MSAVNYSVAEFYLHQREGEGRWKNAAALATVLHLTIFLWSFFLPQFMVREPLIEQVVTVDLVSLPEPESQQSLPPETAPPPELTESPSPPIPAKEPDPVSIAVPAEAEAQSPAQVAEKPISVKPIKRKVKKASDTRLAEERERQRKATELREQLHRQAQREQKEIERRRTEAVRAQKEAEREAERARKALADIYRQQQEIQRRSSSVGRTTARQQENRKVQSIVEQQYYAALFDQVHRYWVLPESRRWDNSLKATVVLTIEKSGKVLRTTVEQKSQDPFFNQLVLKTIASASPMPPIPKLMKKNVIEVGLRFSPGKLEM